jgi:putative transposase
VSLVDKAKKNSGDRPKNYRGDLKGFHGLELRREPEGIPTTSRVLAPFSTPIDLLKALKTIYPFIKVQLCIAHKLRNVAVKIREANQAHCLKEAKLIFAAENRKEAIKRFKTWEARWRVEEARAVRSMRKDLFNCLHFYNFPPERWKSISTTNILERTFREVRRRTWPMNNCFAYEASFDRILYGITPMLNKNWRCKTLKQISTM